MGEGAEVKGVAIAVIRHVSRDHWLVPLAEGWSFIHPLDPRLLMGSHGRWAFYMEKSR